ncbi:DUF4097 family beta strand repeat-containing protein [Opitutus terrae]|uniref:DUF4097 domain-containing protein n=1 Tax=Opitutus terrae (strain DSM 11246 / JCM 15787 / PB90-1) TaxID=452637 RepID=B1ZXZ3_OPITP|nr:DUF4097 family beta strand repeat-containing protein [Opitutus terrae]ACB75192.1 conserved hypothetical protein [Opitutus terrae PB90-1]
MKPHTLLIAAGLLAVVPVSASAKIERVIEKTFAVQPGEMLRVETQGGNIRVQTADDNKVTVVATERIKASSEAEADELLKNLEMTIEQDGEGVLAKAKYEKRMWGSLPVQVDFTVTVPRRYNANLRTSGGNVKLGDLDGRVEARTSGGDIGLGKISGDIAAHTSGGNVTLEEGGGRVKLGTSGGNVRVERAVGETDLNTSGGNIEVKSVEGQVTAGTSGGDVRAGINGALKGDCVLKTSGGNVRAVVDRTVGFQLDASTSGGSVHAEGLTITIDKGGAGRSRLSGKVNGGGPLLKLHTSGGDVVIETQ